MSWSSRNDKDITHLNAGPLPGRKSKHKRVIPKLDWTYNKAAKAWYCLTKNKYKCIVNKPQPLYLTIYDETGFPVFMLTKTMTPLKARRRLELWIDDYNIEQASRPLSCQQSP